MLGKRDDLVSILNTHIPYFSKTEPLRFEFFLQNDLTNQSLRYQPVLENMFEILKNKNKIAKKKKQRSRIDR